MAITQDVCVYHKDFGPGEAEHPETGFVLHCSTALRTTDNLVTFPFFQATLYRDKLFSLCKAVYDVNQDVKATSSAAGASLLMGAQCLHTFQMALMG